MQVNELTALIAAVSESGVKHFSYHTGLESIEISKRDGEISDCEIKVTDQRKQPGRVWEAREQPPYAQSEITAMPAEAAADRRDAALVDVTAPNVGTVLLNDVKTGEPVVAVGDVVQKDQLLFVIESMKLFIDVTAPVSGRVAQICVNSQQTVEFGTVIMKIETEKQPCLQAS